MHTSLFIVAATFWFYGADAMVMDPVTRARILEESQPDENVFIATIVTDRDDIVSCATVASAIQARCSEITPGLDQTGDVLSDIRDSESCFLTFRCDAQFVESDQLESEFDDVVAVEHDEVVVVESYQSWGLNRIDQLDLPLGPTSGQFLTAFTGAGVNVYVVDTGINLDHTEFGPGRVRPGFDLVNDADGRDDNGHGTHCAATAVGSTYGVARDATVFPVKVLTSSGSGSSSNVVRGIEWAVSNQKMNFAGAPAVISLSLGGAKNSAMDNAARAASRAGHIVVVAAGNQDSDACGYSPASAGGEAGATGVISVGSTDRGDQRSSFSNFGKCVDLFAPGTSIKSAWIGDPDASRTISGTSMATPHVAGVAATLLEKHKHDRARAQTELLSITAPNKVTDARDQTPNKLLQTTRSTDTMPTIAPVQAPTLPPPALLVGDVRLDETRIFQAVFSPRVSSASPTYQGPLRTIDSQCGPFTPPNPQVYRGAIVAVSRGGCTFHDKAFELQKLGAVAVLIYQDSPAVPFAPKYYGTSKVTIPVAMISRQDFILISQYKDRATVTWGSGTAPSRSPTRSPVAEPKENPPFVSIGDNKKCSDATKALFLKKRVRDVRTYEECTLRCIKSSRCTHINYDVDPSAANRCQLIRKCVVVDSTDYSGYRYVKKDTPHSTPPPSQPPFDKMFLKDEDNFCRTNRASTQIKGKMGLDVDLHECGAICMAEPECIYINYNEGSPSRKYCDLVRNKCIMRKAGGEGTKHAYKKLLV